MSTRGKLIISAAVTGAGSLCLIVVGARCLTAPSLLWKFAGLTLLLNAFIVPLGSFVAAGLLLKPQSQITTGTEPAPSNTGKVLVCPFCGGKSQSR